MPDIREVTALYATPGTGLPTTSEAVLLTATQIVAPVDADTFLIFGYVNISTGAGTTAVVIRVRRGLAITDPLVSVAFTQLTPTVGQWSIVFGVSDQPGIVATANYVVTGQQTAATGNGTMNGGFIMVLAL